MGFLSSGKKAAKKQAAATLTAANLQATDDAYVAQAASQSTETAVAQNAAAQSAAELLSVPQQSVDVNLAPDTPDAAIDPDTGRRKTVRSTFQSTPAGGTGIKL